MCLCIYARQLYVVIIFITMDEEKKVGSGWGSENEKRGYQCDG